MSTDAPDLFGTDAPPPDEEPVEALAAAAPKPRRTTLAATLDGPALQREPTARATPNGQAHHNCTDLGNAERFFDRFGADARYCKGLGQWLLWDDRRWAEDTTDRVMLMAKIIVRGLHAEAADCLEDAVRQAVGKHAFKSESAERQAALVRVAAWDQRLAVKAIDLDAWPLRLNCRNGIVDLETGKLWRHERSELHTRMAPVLYDPQAQSDLWDYFLFTATGGDQEYQGFLQRAAGYSLTGLTTEEKLFLIHGPKQAGKSTFMDALKAALGTYARTADFETFMAKQQGHSGPRDDIAELVGARLVASIEVEQGRRFAEALVKEMTGGDTVRARALYRAGFEFKPQFKLWLVANHAPRCDADDAALFRRILRLPFDHSIPEKDKDPRVKQRLADPGVSGPAILAWAVRGCLEWQRIGLAPPKSIVDATEAYRATQDPLADFIADCCVIEPSASCRSALLMQEYERWAKATGVTHAIGYRAMAERLRTRGMAPDELGPERFRGWKGIGIKDVSSDAAMF
jgi:putative DNA primase/helicase